MKIGLRAQGLIDEGPQAGSNSSDPFLVLVDYIQEIARVAGQKSGLPITFDTFGGRSSVNSRRARRQPRALKSRILCRGLARRKLVRGKAFVGGLIFRHFRKEAALLLFFCDRSFRGRPSLAAYVVCLVAW